MCNLKVLNIYENTSSNGDGWRTAIFLAGCPHRCNGCFNPESWEFDSGKDMDVKAIIEIIEKNLKWIDGITWLGGEPIQDRYYNGIKEITDYVKSKGKTIWCYTGYEFEELDSKWKIFDTIIDGKFIKELATSKCKFRGSSNQRMWRKQNGTKYIEL